MSGDPARVFGEVLRRRWPVVLACVLVMPLAAFGFTRLQPRQYQATASVLLNDPSTAAGIAGADQAAAVVSDQTTLLSTEQGLASAPKVSETAAQALGRPYASGGLPGSVSVGDDGVSNLLTFTATERTPSLAARVANAYAQAYMQFQAGATVAQIARQRADIAARIAQLKQAGSARSRGAIAQLNQTDASLATLATLQNSNSQLVAPARPSSSPSSPRTAATVVAGGALGLLLGILLAFLFVLLDRRIHDSSDVEAVLEGPVLGAIPISDTIRRAGQRHRVPVGAAESESFAMVHANITHYNHDQPIRSVLVTSASGGDGKTTVAVNLALAGALAGSRVLLIEADLRNPTMAGRLGARPHHGLSDLLAGSRLPLRECLCSVTIDETGGVTISGEVNGNGSATPGPAAGAGENDDSETAAEFDALFAVPDNDDTPGYKPGSLLGSRRMRDLLVRVQSDYDLVVIDTPPSPLVADAIPLFGHVSGVVLVTRLRKNTRADARQLQIQIENLQARTLGVVVNGVDSVDQYYERSPSSYEQRSRSKAVSS